MWRNFRLLHICHVEKCEINLRFLHICHVQKFEIVPHDRFFSTGTTRGARDKYQVCPPSPGESSFLWLLYCAYHESHKFRVSFITRCRSPIYPPVWHKRVAEVGFYISPDTNSHSAACDPHQKVGNRGKSAILPSHNLLIWAAKTKRPGAGAYLIQTFNIFTPFSDASIFTWFNIIHVCRQKYWGGGGGQFFCVCYMLQTWSV